MEFELLDKALHRLINAVSKGCSTAYCHRLWSNFIRLRDLNRCVVCNSSKRVAAHHILRKSFLSGARFEPGNGITLCLPCHKEVHRIFNRVPDLQQPMDAEGGENIELMVELLGYLAADAFERGILSNKYYFLSDRYIETCKKFQGIEKVVQFPGTRLEQAYWIWRQSPREVIRALFLTNGVDVPENFIQLGPITWK